MQCGSLSANDVTSQNKDEHLNDAFEEKIGRTGWNVSKSVLGRAIGGSWGGVAEDDAKRAKRRAR